VADKDFLAFLFKRPWHEQDSQLNSVSARPDNLRGAREK
jgi:hypothetical protein